MHQCTLAPGRVWGFRKKEFITNVHSPHLHCLLQFNFLNPGCKRMILYLILVSAISTKMVLPGRPDEFFSSTISKTPASPPKWSSEMSRILPTFSLFLSEESHHHIHKWLLLHERKSITVEGDLLPNKINFVLYWALIDSRSGLIWGAILDPLVRSSRHAKPH